MHCAKLTSEERESLREQRLERQWVMAKAKQRRFEYIVNPPPIPRVAFGSSMNREVLPVTGPAMSSFMRAIQGEILEYPGPFEHYVDIGMEKEFPSRRGMSCFASKTVRPPKIKVTNFPPIGAYDIEPPRSKKQMARPFNSGAKRGPLEGFLTPGPSCYPHHLPLPRPKVSLAFGGKRRTISYVAIFCTPKNYAKCQLCGRTPYGDYFHNFSNGLSICQPCMNLTKAEMKHCALDSHKRNLVRREMRRYKPARHCGFYHDHQGTTAAIAIMTKAMLRLKIRKENYLSAYFK